MSKTLGPVSSYAETSFVGFFKDPDDLAALEVELFCLTKGVFLLSGIFLNEVLFDASIVNYF